MKQFTAIGNECRRNILGFTFGWHIVNKYLHCVVAYIMWRQRINSVYTKLRDLKLHLQDCHNARV